MPALTVLLVVKDERDRLPDALASVRWADEIVVADTGSSDGTQALAEAAGARVVSIPWEGFVKSKNRALQEPRHDWVFLLDADERVTAELKEEILAAIGRDDGDVAGLRMPRLSYFLGSPIRHGTWYPDFQLRVGRRTRGLRAVGGRVHESHAVDGPVAKLKNPLVHHPYRDVSDALRKAGVYARLAADDRYDRGQRGSALGLVFRPIFEFFRCFVLKAGFLDGYKGSAVAFLHASSYFLRAAFLLEIDRRQALSRRAQKEASS